MAISALEKDYYLGVYDKAPDIPGTDWQQAALEASSNYQAISQCVRTSPLGGRKLSQQHERYVYGFLESEYFHSVLESLYGESIVRGLEVIPLDLDNNIRSELEKTQLSIPDFLVVLKRHVMTLDAKLAPSTNRPLDSDQISHDNLRRVVGSSLTLSKLVGNKIEGNIKYIRGKLILPHRQRYIEYLDIDNFSLYDRHYFTSAVFNLQNLEIAEEWRDIIFCPSSIIIENLQAYIDYFHYKLNTMGNIPSYINLLSRTYVHNNLQERLPDLFQKGERIIIKEPYEGDEIVQTLFLALMQFKQEEEGMYEFIDTFLQDHPEITSLSALSNYLYGAYYFLDAALDSQLHPSLLKKTRERLMDKRIPSIMFTYKDAKGDLHPAKLSCYNRELSLRVIKRQVSDTAWSLYETGELNLGNYQEVLNQIIDQAAHNISKVIEANRVNFNPAEFNL